MNRPYPAASSLLSRVASVACAAIALCGVKGTIYGADPVPWKPIAMSTTVNDQPVSDFIKDFASSQGISVSVSEEATGTVNGSFIDKMPSEIFESIVKAYGLVPYYDGSILYIYAASEMKSSVIALEQLPTQDYRKLLIQLSVFDDQFTFRELDEQGIIYVSGPPRYVDLLEELALKFEARNVEKTLAETAVESVAAAEIQVRYFPLRYAQADDVTLDFQDREVTIPGVARLLGRVLGEDAPEIREVGKKSSKKPRTVERLKGSGLVDGETPVRINQETEVERSEVETRREVADEREEEVEQLQTVGAFVQADSRLNAVIVADRAEKMPLYERLIQDLDQPAGVIEINAAIIDINANANVDFGVDYRGQSLENIELNPAGVPATTGLFRAGQNAGADLVDGAALVGGGGLNTSALIVGTTFQILARIRAMETAGEAQVLSRPSIITVDNTEATLRDDQTIYIRVAGQEEVDLFPVSAGVVLQVTPHLIYSSGKGEVDKIRLQVKIEDGDFTAAETVDGIPTVRRSEITTQAVVAQNESLLIGGQYRHEQSNNETRVPIAGRIPVLKNAFRNKEVVNRKQQRLFLISPNVINPDTYYRKAEELSREVIDGPPLNELKHQGRRFQPDSRRDPDPNHEIPTLTKSENSTDSEHTPVRATPVETGENEAIPEKKPSFFQRMFRPK